MDKTDSKAMLFFRTTIGPLLLILTCPFFALVMWYTCVHLDGSFAAFVQLCLQQGFFETLYQIGFPYVFGTHEAWIIIALFILCQLAFMRLLPGKIFHGPLTPQGNIPVYKANGVAAFFGTLFLCR